MKRRASQLVIDPAAGAMEGVRSFDLRAFDGLRGLAALYIVVNHASFELWVGSHRALATGGFAAVLAYAAVPFRYGSEVVLLFFLLSGFVIHLRQAQSLARGEMPSFRAVSFFRRRAIRLLPPLLFALLLTAALDQVGSQANQSFYEAVSIRSHSRSAFTFVMNALFLQGFAAPTFGSNSPLWSLSYEAIFYALYPAFLFARVHFGARTAFGATFAAGAAGSAVHAAVSPAIAWTISPYFAVWTLGAFIAEAFARDLPLRRPLLMLALACPLIVPLLAVRGVVDPTLRSSIFAPGLALVMAVFVLHPAGLGFAAVLARLRGLGARSYTLYVIHLPILICMAALWVRARGDPPASGWLAFVGIVAAVAAASAVAPIVELPFSERAKLRSLPATRSASHEARRRSAMSGRSADVMSEEVADERRAA